MRKPESYQAKSEVLRDISMLDQRLFRMMKDHNSYVEYLEGGHYMVEKDRQQIHKSIKLLQIRIEETEAELARLNDVLKRFPDIRLVGSITNNDNEM